MAAAMKISTKSCKRTMTVQKTTFPRLYQVLTTLKTCGQGTVNCLSPHITNPDSGEGPVNGYEVVPEEICLNKLEEYNATYNLTDLVQDTLKDVPADIPDSCSPDITDDWTALDVLEPSITWSDDHQLLSDEFEMQSSSDSGLQLIRTSVSDDMHNLADTSLLRDDEFVPSHLTAGALPGVSQESEKEQRLHSGMDETHGFGDHGSTCSDVQSFDLDTVPPSLSSPSTSSLPEGVSSGNGTEKTLRKKQSGTQSPLPVHSDLNGVIALALSSTEATGFDLPELQDAFLNFFEHGEVSAELDSYFTKVLADSSTFFGENMETTPDTGRKTTNVQISGDLLGNVEAVKDPERRKALERRIRNNAASRRSRAAHKARFQSIAHEIGLLESENHELAIWLGDIQETIRQARHILSQGIYCPNTQLGRSELPVLPPKR